LVFGRTRTTSNLKHKIRAEVEAEVQARRVVTEDDLLSKRSVTEVFKED
jgi:hypothetical protein